MSDHTGADGEGRVDQVCHDEQMTVWTGEIAGSLSMGGYLREDLSYDDNLDVHAVIAKDLRSIIGSALTHPALPAAPISPSEREAIEAAGRALYMKNRGVPADAWDRDLPESTRDHWRDYARTALGAAGWLGPHAPCDGSGASRQDAQRLDPKDDSAVDEASSVVEAPASQDLKALQAENERLKAELASVNNEFGSQTPDWPEAWKRVADLKQLAGDRWRENVDLKDQIHVLTTALAESERRRVEDSRRTAAFIDLARLIAEQAIDPAVRQTALDLIDINSLIASTPTQETPDAQG